MSLTCEKQRYLNEKTLLIRTVVIGNISIDHFCEKHLVSVVNKKKQKKDHDPTIWAVTNIHTRFYIQIHEYPSTRILAAALAITHTIAIKWKEKYDAVVVDCHHSLRLCGERMKMSLNKKDLFLGDSHFSLDSI